MLDLHLIQGYYEDTDLLQAKTLKLKMVLSLNLNLTQAKPFLNCLMNSTFQAHPSLSESGIDVDCAVRSITYALHQLNAADGQQHYPSFFLRSYSNYLQCDLSNCYLSMTATMFTLK